MIDNNYSNKILESYIEVERLNKEYQEKLYSFLNKCKELEDMSNHIYEIQKTLEQNKVFFQGYVCDFELCEYLNENTDKNYSVDELRKMIKQAEENSGSDFSSYILALDLYKEANSLEDLYDNKIEYEMNKIASLTNSIYEINRVNPNEYDSIYNKLKEEITSRYLNNNLMDDKAFDMCNRMLNDIFNYYTYGYLDIPNDYLYKEDESA